MKLFRLVLAFTLGLSWQSANAAPYKTIHAFKGGLNDGRTPTFASLTASGNILYGVTLDGGKYTNGVVFKFNTGTSVETLLHTFNGDSVLNPDGSKFDGAYPLGTPVLDPSGTTLYGMTEEGGSNGYVGGTIYSVNADGSGGFKILHHFGGVGDGWAPQGSLILSGTTLFGMTSSGGTNFGDDEGTIFTIQTDGSGYKVYHDFTVPGEGDPNGSLLLWGTTLFGMTQGSIFAIETNGASFATIHEFTGTTTDGANAHGSLIRQGGYLYGMTLQGGQNSVGTVFQLEFFPRNFQILHSFSMSEAYSPYGDLALSGSTLYGITSGGVTNYYHRAGIPSVGSGAVFQIQTNGSDYQVMHTFLFNAVPNDGSLPFGSPIVVGSQLYGMTSLGGGSADGGCIFSLTLPASSGGGGGGSGTAPTITTTSPLPDGKVGVAYKQQLEASGGATPYTWALSAGHLPPGLTLSAVGVLGGKPTTGEIAAFSIKVTGHDKLTSSQAFALTVEAPPTLTITAPKLNQKVTAPTLNIGGAVTEKVGTATVNFQLNGGAWTAAQIANGAWSYPNLPLAADENVLSAYAVDSFGNHSKTNTVKFEYYVTGPLIVTTTGSGSFAPPDNGKNFQIGATFTITAKPAKGFVFEDWTNGLGTVLTHEAGLRFVMSSNLMLVANFVPSFEAELAHGATPDFARPAKSFQGAAGNYAGLFAPSSDMRQLTNSGAIRLTLTESGLFSGKLNLGSESIPFAGSFDASGASRLIIPRKKTALSATLQLDFAHQSVTGEVTDGAFTAQVMSYRGGFSPATSYQGTYNVVITSADISSVPPLIPTGTLEVDASGNATFSGTLPDGTHATQTSLISTDGYWPLYLPVCSGSGSESSSVWSWNQLTNGTVRSLPAASTWITGTNKTSIQIIGTGNHAPNQQ